MRPRRYLEANQVYFASARVREGLPFIPDPLMKTFVEGVLARAQELYPVTICHDIFMGNHFHLLFVCKDPTAVINFFCYVKTALAIGINKLTGRRGPVWENRTDMPIVLTLEKAIELIVYIYTNPASSSITSSISSYPGISSWQAFKEDKTSKQCTWIKTSQLKRIYRCIDELRARTNLLREISDSKKAKQVTLKLSPNEWMKCFGINNEKQIKEINDLIFQKINERELQLNKERISLPARAALLKTQSLYKKFKPKKFNNRVYCLSHNSNIRKSFIRKYKDLVYKCKEVYNLWKQGCLDITMPLGMLSPPKPLLAVAIYQNGYD